MDHLAVVVVIVLIYIVLTWNTGACDDYLYGFWVADGDDFCDRADAESIMLFIGEPEGWFTVERPIYLVIMNDLCNQGGVLSYRRGWAGPTVGRYGVRAGVKFDDDQLWPERVNLAVNLLDGTLQIEEDGVVYAKLVKQHDTTNIARLAKD